MQAVPPIHIVVANGKVTLEGVVATEGDKNQAGIYATSALARSYPLCCAQHNGYYVEHGIMVSQGPRDEDDEVLRGFQLLSARHNQRVAASAMRSVIYATRNGFGGDHCRARLGGSRWQARDQRLRLPSGTA